MIGNVSACVSILALGLAPNYTVAILSRFLGGLFTSGIGVAVKTIIAESCDAAGQAKAMGYMTSAMGVGSIAGPSIAGLLTRPCRHFASSLSVCEEGSLLQERPFFLPCLVSAVLAVLGLASNVFMMSESHPKFMEAGTKQRHSDIESSSVTDEEPHPQHCSTNIHAIQEAEEVEVQKLLHGKDHGCNPSSRNEASDHASDRQLSEHAAEPWYKDSIVTVCMIAGGLITLFMNYLDELTPIYASAKPAAGGLGMPAHEFAWPLTFGGVVLMVYSLFFYPQAQKRWGYLKCCKIGLLLSVPSLLILPFAHSFVQTKWATQACLFVGIGLVTIFKLMALASAAIIINTVAPMEQIGSVNGAAQTLQGLARCVGPFLAGIVWGSCADSEVSGKQYLPFVGSMVGFTITAIVYMYIKLPD